MLWKQYANNFINISTPVKLIVIIFFCLLCQTSLSQIIVGKVIGVDNERISFASIAYFNNRVGVTSDESGSFFIKRIPGDSIKFSAVGYVPRIVQIDTISNNIVVRLIRKRIELQEVIVIPKFNRKGLIGTPPPDNTFADRGTPGLQTGIYISNTIEKICRIDEIRFHLSDLNYHKYPVRIRVLSVDSTTGLPHEDLFFSENIIPAKRLKKKMVIDVKKNNIFIGKRGVFISFELLCPVSDCKDAGIPFSFSGTKRVSRNLRYFNFKDLKWVPAPFKIVYEYGTPSVQLKVSY